jgi:nucleoside-diphosphate-sugar epimerase
LERIESRITVFGGSGFLGASSYGAWPTAVRCARRGASPRPGVIPRKGLQDWADHHGLRRRVERAVDQAVVNTVGHYVEQGKATFEAIYAQGALHVARASATAGMRRLVHISGIGAEPTSVSPYVRARKHWRTSGQRSISRSHNPPPERHVWGLRTNSSIGWLL